MAVNLRAAHGPRLQMRGGAFECNRQTNTRRYAKAVCDVIESVALERTHILLTDRPNIESLTESICSNNSKDRPHYVAEHNGRIIAWADITSPLASGIAVSYRSPRYGRAKKYRGRGIGRRLTSTVLEKAWGHGFKRLELEVFSSNEVAITLYRRHGVEIEGTGTKRYALCLDSRHEDILIMAQYRI